MKKNIIYDRDYNVGTEKIRKERVEKIKEKASKMNIYITDTYLDYDKNNKGIQLKKLLDVEELEKEKIDTVIVYSLDRISRNLREVYNILGKLDRYKVECLVYDMEMKSISSVDRTMMLILDKTIKREELKQARYEKNGRYEIDKVFSEIQFKKKKLGNLLCYKNQNGVKLDTGECLGEEYNNFSDEQLDTAFIVTGLDKSEENKFEIIVKFAKEEDQDKFEDVLYPYKDYYEYEEEQE